MNKNTFLARGAFAKRRSTPSFFIYSCIVQRCRGPPVRNLTSQKTDFKNMEEPKMTNNISLELKQAFKAECKVIDLKQE